MKTHCGDCGHDLEAHASKELGTPRGGECFAVVTDYDLTNEHPDSYCGCPEFVQPKAEA